MQPDSKRTEEFMRLFLAAEGRIYAYVRAAIPNQADAEEVLQEIAAAAWRKFGEFEVGTNFRAWIMKIGYFEVLNFRRSAARNPVTFDQEAIQLLADTDESSRDAPDAVRHALSQCVERLSADERRLIRLRYESDMSNLQVAEVEGRSPSAISHAVHRIRERLLRCMRRVLAKEQN